MDGIVSYQAYLEDFFMYQKGKQTASQPTKFLCMDKWCG